MRILLLLITWMISELAHADVMLMEQFEHYTIAPEDVDQIKVELRNNSPISRQNQVFHGGTEWNLIPDFHIQKHHNLCRIGAVRVILNGTYTMPKLQSEHTVPVMTRQRFDAYYNALLEHEKGHQDLWLQAGEEIERLLNNFEPFFDCRALTEEARERVKAIIAKYRIRNQQYDIVTGHGRTQGAAIK